MRRPSRFRNWYNEWRDLIVGLIVPLTVIVVIIGIVLWLIVGTAGNRDYVKKRAADRFDDLGYEITGYEGYKFGFWGYNEYGGAHVRYILKKKPDNGITYSGALQRWGDEIHLTYFRAVDAIKP